VTEAAVLGLPAVFVPLPHGNGEQRRNADAVVAAGGAVVVADEDFTPVWVAQHVVPLAGDADRLARMGAASRGLMRRDADEALARMVLEAAA
jgi:UDP-N-acetylglucosamine--N-acetylmuramyl-(pentapeptide) pyrophosphoryl-undecaprenol N-acetylglucosamine transferase